MKGAFRITDNLTKWMEIKGWNQRQLAEELGCDESLISSWFYDSARKTQVKHPSWQAIRKLCFLTGLDIGELLTLDRDIEQED